MDPKKLFKLRRNAYIVCLLIVAVAAALGFYQNYRNTGHFFSETGFLEKKKEKLFTDETLTIKEGDKVSIDFVGYVDGEEVEGGNTQGHGIDIVVGDGKLIGDMETQLIGHHPGENFTMTITFADDYKNEDLRGKEATIDMTVNGIYGTAKK